LGALATIQRASDRFTEPIDAPDMERVFEGDDFSPRADCHARLHFADAGCAAICFVHEGTMRPFALVSYLFLAE
jgi:hypothetical protein